MNILTIPETILLEQLFAEWKARTFPRSLHEKPEWETYAHLCGGNHD